MPTYDLIIVGAGAAGIFAALRVANLAPGAKILILEKTGVPLRKVKISGGGRCNVTHNQNDIPTLTSNYPRGSKFLKGPFHDFKPQDTVDWFQERGVQLKVEDDGRMFPKSDSSQTIIDCFMKEIEQRSITLSYKEAPLSLSPLGDSFEIKTSKDNTYQTRFLFIATGSDKSGHSLARELGHQITELAPSLFTFKIKTKLFNDLAGTSFPNAILKCKLGKGYQQIGPVLITHWGLSGPATLKLSAFAAREIKSCHYKFDLMINFTGRNFDEEKKNLEDFKKNLVNKKIKNTIPKNITKNFWLSLLKFHDIELDSTWQEISKKIVNKLATSLTGTLLKTNGHHRFKEEFVECGGISLKELSPNYASKVIPNLYFGGEILDIDGVTGGFNFQNAWTSSYLAGSEIAKKLNKP